MFSSIRQQSLGLRARMRSRIPQPVARLLTAITPPRRTVRVHQPNTAGSSCRPGEVSTPAVRVREQPTDGGIVALVDGLPYAIINKKSSRCAADDAQARDQSGAAGAAPAWSQPLDVQVRAYRQSLPELLVGGDLSGWRMRLPACDETALDDSTVVEDPEVVADCVKVYREGRYPIIVCTPAPTLFADDDPGAIIRVKEADWSRDPSRVVPVPRVVFGPFCSSDGPQGSVFTRDPVETALLYMANEGPIRIDGPMLVRDEGVAGLVVRTPWSQHKAGCDGFRSFRAGNDCAGLVYRDRETLARRVVWLASPDARVASRQIDEVAIILASNIPAALARWINETAVQHPRLLALETTRIVHGGGGARGVVDVLALDLAAVWMNPDGSTRVTMLYVQQPMTTTG